MQQGDNQMNNFKNSILRFSCQKIYASQFYT